MRHSKVLEHILLSLPDCHDQHAFDTVMFKLLSQIARTEIEQVYADKAGNFDFEPFGALKFPYYSMGAVDALNLFDFNELIIFSFYWVNRTRYRNVLDLGANLGLHTVLLTKCGFDVTCYEPDPLHFELLQKNLVLNNISSVQALNKAISIKDGEAEFVRVCGNTTGNHLAGAKRNPYGQLERFLVKTAEFKSLMPQFDFIKIDIEGHEKEVLLSTDNGDWKDTDAMVEVGTVEAGEAIFQHFNKIGVALYSQKINWGVVKRLDDMPFSYKEGTLFISNKPQMPW